MKITRIEVINGIHHVTRTPNLFECLFGKKEVVERYKQTGEVYVHFPSVKVFRRSDGEIPLPYDKVIKALNNFINAF